MISRNQIFKTLIYFSFLLMCIFLTIPQALSEENIHQYLKNKASWGVACEFNRNGELVVGTVRIDFDKKKIIVIYFEHYYGSYDKVTYKHHFTPQGLEYLIKEVEFVDKNEVIMKGINKSGDSFSAHWNADNLKFELTEEKTGIKITNITKDGRNIQDKYFPNVDLAYPH
jgi:hypothetical protein